MQCLFGSHERQGIKKVEKQLLITAKHSVAFPGIQDQTESIGVLSKPGTTGIVIKLIKP